MTTTTGARTAMTDAEAAALRAKVPDDPARLPENSLACEACGVAVPVPPEPHREPLLPQVGEKALPHREKFARCPECAKVREQAEQYVAKHPALAARMGPWIARERIESVLLGLTILGRPLDVDDLGLLLPRMHPPSHEVWFNDPLTPTRGGRCSPHPFAHVTLTQRAELRKAYAAVLRDRLAKTQPSVPVRCPSAACLLCGVGKVERSALEVARRGGPIASASTVWRPVMTSQTALGRTGPDRVTGHVCPACNSAIEEAGAIGQTAIGNAVLAHVAIRAPKKAKRLLTMLEDDFPPRLLGWGVLNQRPNPEPWWHLVKVLDRI